MSTPTEGRLPVSTANAVLLTVFLAGAVVTAVAGSWFEAGLLAAVGLAVLAMAVYARRPNSRDITRVNAIEYRDERDKRIAQVGFSVVGVVALAVSAIELVAVAVLVAARDWPQPVQLLPVGQLLLLSTVWGIANSIAARRG
ncbi:hypothetical protein [uncultured Modestobacter sp.]|uniref:hypothetical protein n=1 Tax=uncultured Modestobacter sp. TaxID=380048 RepID=UPI0026109399|nr:hypothetical protein [uncultured Modestobacter sp.]